MRSATADDLVNARGNVLNAMAERDNVVPPAAVEPVMQLVGDPARREELRLPGGHVTFGTGRGGQAHDAEADAAGSSTTATKASRSHDGDPTDRARRRAGAGRFFARIPEADRTFFKEDVDDPGRGRRLGAARRGARDRRRRRRDRRVGRGGAAARLVEPRRRDAPRRRPRIPRTRAGRRLARHAVLDAVELGLAKLVVEVDGRPGGADRACSGRSGSSRRRCCRPRARSAGEIRDLLVLANDVESQFAAMATAGITDQL